MWLLFCLWRLTTLSQDIAGFDGSQSFHINLHFCCSSSGSSPSGSGASATVAVADDVVVEEEGTIGTAASLAMAPKEKRRRQSRYSNTM